MKNTDLYARTLCTGRGYLYSFTTCTLIILYKNVTMQPASTKIPCDFYVCKYRNIPHIPHIHPYTHTPIHHKVKRTVEEEDHTVEQIQRDSLWSSQGEGEPHAR